MRKRTKATGESTWTKRDKTTGKLLWETQLEAVAYATPSAYEVNGKQYIVIAAGGGGGMQSDSILEDAAGAQPGFNGGWAQLAGPSTRINVDPFPCRTC